MNKTALESRKQALRKEINQAKLLLNQNLEEMDLSSYLLPDKNPISNYSPDQSNIINSIIGFASGYSQRNILGYFNIARHGLNILKSLYK